MRPSYLRNRLCLPSRLPTNPRDRLEIADRDLGFTEALERLGLFDDVLERINIRAFAIRLDAQNELLRKGVK